jgi:hypothetical protein
MRLPNKTNRLTILIIEACLIPHQNRKPVSPQVFFHFPSLVDGTDVAFTQDAVEELADKIVELVRL